MDFKTLGHSNLESDLHNGGYYFMHVFHTYFSHNLECYLEHTKLCSIKILFVDELEIFLRKISGTIVHYSDFCSR